MRTMELETRVMNLEHENQELRRALKEVIDSQKEIMQNDDLSMIAKNMMRVTKAITNAQVLLRR